MSYIYGTEELRAKLRQLSTKDMKAAIRKGTRAGAKIVQHAAKETVPVDTGALRSQLKVRSIPRTTKSIGNMVRSSGTAYWGGFTEFGTKYQQAQHWLKQAADTSKDAAMQAAVTTIADAIQKVGQ